MQASLKCKMQHGRYQSLQQNLNQMAHLSHLSNYQSRGTSIQRVLDLTTTPITSIWFINYFQIMQSIDIKANTTPLQYQSSTLFNPDVKAIIQAVSIHLYQQLEQEKGQQISKTSELFFFSEEKYIEEKPEEFDDQRKQLLRDVPSVDNIYEFMKALFDCAQFSPECCIICLIYITRLMAFTGLTLQPTNWRPLLLSSLLVAQKVWDDSPITNADFAFIYPFFTTEEINKLEAKFLELLQYNLTLNSQLYAKYYFKLRDIYNKPNSEFFLQPLNVEQQSLLETRSAEIQQKEQSKAQKMSLTFDEKTKKNSQS